MGDSLATVDMGRKVGAESLLGGSWVPHLTQCCLHQGCTKWHLDPLSPLAAIYMGQKVGLAAVPPFWGVGAG